MSRAGPAGNPAAAPRHPAVPALAVTLPQFATETGPAVAACRDAHRLGFAGAFLFDHLWPLGGPRTRPALECWTMLAALAAAVGRLPQGDGHGSGGLRPEGSGEPQGGAPAGGGAWCPPGESFRLGTLVTRAGMRAPALVARMAATVGQAARVPPVVGVGRGDAGNQAENLAFGLPYPDAAGRALAVEATVAALRSPLAGVPRPAVWVGGAGRGGRELAGRLADAWNGWALTPEELAGGLADTRRVAERAGRDPAAVQGTWGGQVLVAGSRDEAKARLDRWASGRPPAEVARTLAGDPDAVLARLAELHQAGAAWCVLAPVGGSGASMRALLADAAGLAGRGPVPETK